MEAKETADWLGTEFAEFCSNVYQVPNIIKYEVDEQKVAGLGATEKMDYLKSLFHDVALFIDKLMKEMDFQNHFLIGLNCDEGDKHFDNHPLWRMEIEKGLEKHFHLAGRQIARALICLPYCETTYANKQKIVKSIFEQYNIAVEYNSDWQTDPMFSLLEDNRGDYEELAGELGSTYGIVFDEEHREIMADECATFDPTKPSYQHNKEVMKIDISQPTPPPMEEDSKQPAK